MSSPSVALQSTTSSEPARTVAASATESVTSSPNVQNPSFVGNTPSTVLFFLALAVGVFIAALFVFFTVRYFVRSKYGLHVYPLTHRNFMASSSLLTSVLGPGGGPDNSPSGGTTGSNRSPGFLSSNPTNEEIYEQLEFIREYAARRGDTWNGRMYMNPRARRRRRRRRGRFAKMKKLSEEEVEILFPKKTYHDWLNGGKERDHEQRDGVLQEDPAAKGTVVETTEVTDEVIRSPSSASKKVKDLSHDITSLNEPAVVTTTSMTTTTNTTTISSSEVIELEDMHPTNSSDDVDLSSSKPEHVHDESVDSLHFTSGTCAICLDSLEDEDIVRGLICGHVFHAECLDPWLIKRRACCPMCKRDYLYKNPNATPTNEAGTSANATADATNNENNNENTSNDNNTPSTDEAAARGDTASNEDDEEDRFSVDIEALRSDPALRALIQELIPIDERVQLILRDPSLANLNIEEIATQRASKKYGTFKAIWWRLMGISKKDLFNWLVMKMCLEHREATASETSDQPQEGAEEGIIDGAPVESTRATESSESSPETREVSPHTEETGNESRDENSGESACNMRRNVVEQRV